MADISVTLVLDDAQYVGKLASATTKTEAFAKQAKASTDHAGGGFDGLSGKAEMFGSKMEKLTTILLGVGFLEMAHRALNLADSISDLSQGSDVSIAKILQLREAFEDNGGSAEKLGKIISKLSNYIQEARDGSSQAQESLLRLGFSFKDMANMDTEEAMGRVIDKLAGMSDAMERNALAVRVFGKDAKLINWEGIKQAAGGSTEEFKRQEAQIKANGAAHDNLVKATERLTLAFGGLMEKVGITAFINNISTSMEKMGTVVAIAGTAFALYFGAAFLANVATALPLVEKGIKGVAGAVALLDTALSAGLIARFGAFARLLVTSAAGLASIGALLATYSSNLNEGEDDLIKKQHALADSFNALPEKYKAMWEKMSNDQKTKTQKLIGDGKSWQEAISQVLQLKDASTPAWAGATAQIRQQIDAYKVLSETKLRNYEEDTRLIGSGKELSDSQKLWTARAEELWTKQRAIDDAMEVLRANRNAGNQAETDAKLAAYAKVNKAITEQYNKDSEIWEKDEAIRSARLASDRLQLFVNSEKTASAQRLLDIESATTQLTMNSTQKQMAAVDLATKKTIAAEIEKERALLGTKATTEMVDSAIIKSITDTAEKQAQIEKKAIQEQIDRSRQFSTGWKQAFNDYIDNATNAATQAQSIFNAMTNGMSNAIDKFVDTGKFSFGDFANSVIRDIIKIQMKANVANIIGGVNSGGGLMNMLSGLFRAEGGSVKSGQPYIVGEKGPEMFVPNSGGNIIPNKMIGSSQNTPTVGAPIINYNISAVDANSFKVMLAQDPNFLYAVTEQGRKSLPQTRR